MSWMLDHPSWNPCPLPARTMRTETGVWLIKAAATYDPVLLHGEGAAPRLDIYDPATLEGLCLPTGLAQALQGLNPVRRVTNADLWDALATAIIRQVIRAVQARKLYRQLLTTAGDLVAGHRLFPSADTVAGMTDYEFAALGLTFKRGPLRAAAAAYLSHGPAWLTLPPADLVEAVQQVPRIGPWTAGAAVADYTGDFSFYPCADLAVRTWARTADPDTTWPLNEPAFAERWRRAAGPSTTALSTLTALTLAWGDRHARKPVLAGTGASPG